MGKGKSNVENNENRGKGKEEIFMHCFLYVLGAHCKECWDTAGSIERNFAVCLPFPPLIPQTGWAQPHGRRGAVP